MKGYQLVIILLLLFISSARGYIEEINEQEINYEITWNKELANFLRDNEDQLSVR